LLGFAFQPPATSFQALNGAGILLVGGAQGGVGTGAQLGHLSRGLLLQLAELHFPPQPGVVLEKPDGDEEDACPAQHDPPGNRGKEIRKSQFEIGNSRP
jgi:hypothetical protein